MADTCRWGLLGTAGGHIENVEYSPKWPRVFECEATAILETSRPWITEVHHIGSTSVARLAAKPIMDIVLAVANPAEGSKAVCMMEPLGYRYRGENGIAGRFYFDKIIAGRTVVQAHLFPVNHPDVSKHLMFRDYLRAHPDAAHEYAQLKRELASKYRDDRRAYTDAKAEFMSGITKIATEWTRSLA